MASESRQNITAGIFVLAGIALATVTLITIQRLTIAPRTAYQVEFGVTEGVGGLAPGADVRVGGLTRGDISRIEAIGEDGKPITGPGQRLASLRVHIEVDDTIQIYSDAVVIRMLPLLGSSGYLNFVKLGGGEGATLLAKDALIKATSSPGMLATIVGGDNAQKLGTVVDNVERLSELLGEQVPKDYDELVRPSLQDVRTVIADARAQWPTWSGNVSTTLSNAEKSSEALLAGLTDARTLIDDARRPVQDLSDMVQRNAPKVNDIIDRADKISVDADLLITDLNSKAMPKLLSLLDDADDAVKQISSTLDVLKPEILRQLPQLRTMLSDLRVASAELKLATIEVRRNPWRLLYRPSSDIIANENLFDAARSFALAAADLRVAGESLNQIVAADPQALAADPALAESLRQNLSDQLKRYQQAQGDLFRIILGDR